MSVFLGHRRNIDRVDDGTNNETLRQLFRTRSLASHTQVLSEPCNKVTHDTALPLELPVPDPPAMLLYTFYLLDGVESVSIHELLGE